VARIGDTYGCSATRQAYLIFYLAPEGATKAAGDLGGTATV
jgi:hypothetical protein